MLDTVCHFSLHFSHPTVIIPLILIGYIWVDRKVFFHGVCLLLTSILLNAALKATFQVPLSPALGIEGFAFPSGHMQSSTVLYGWLFQGTHRPIIKVVIGTLLVGIGISLVHFGYHHYIDVGGGFLFGVLLIFAYSDLHTKAGRKLLTWIILLLATLAIGYIGLLYNVKGYVWRAYCALLGLIGSEYYFGGPHPATPSFPQKVIATLFCIMAFTGVHYLSSRESMTLSLFQLKWLCMGVLMPFSLSLLPLLQARKI